MPLTPLQLIIVRAPQYLGDIRLPDYITIAESMTGQEYGDCRSMAVALRVLHMLTKDSIAGGGSSNTGVQNGGQVTGEKEGDLSITYSKSSSKASDKFGDLSTTGYGSELIELANGCLFLPRNRSV